MAEHELIWVFNGEGARFPSGVFRTKEAAYAWIAKNGLTGVLTGYPLDEGAYDWAVRNGTFKSKSAKHQTPEFIQTFTAGAQPHHHFEQGKDMYPPGDDGESV
jgi:hypothetical protein